MSPDSLPYLVEARDLADLLAGPGDARPLVICVGKREQYVDGHVPGALWLDPAGLSLGVKPAPGLLPAPKTLESVFASVGLDAGQDVVCYDDNGGTAGARLAWVLEAMGHSRLSLLNGGLGAWLADGLPVESGEVTPAIPVTPWKAHPNPAVIIDKAGVLAALGDPSIRILDARSEDEFLGRKTNSARKGRIPGARNLDWQSTIDRENANRLLPEERLEALLAERGIDREHETIVHCQTHQRSSHAFAMLRSLGYDKVRAYAGSWMEWAADDSLPIIREDTAED